MKKINQVLILKDVLLIYIKTYFIEYQTTQRKEQIRRVCPDQFPDIHTTNITSTILSLYGIGTQLEQIQNLPDPNNPDMFKIFIKNLYIIGTFNQLSNSKLLFAIYSIN